MSAPLTTKGVLYLVPTPLDFGMAVDAAPADTWLPKETMLAASGLTHWK